MAKYLSGLLAFQFSRGGPHSTCVAIYERGKRHNNILSRHNMLGWMHQSRKQVGLKMMMMTRAISQLSRLSGRGLVSHENNKTNFLVAREENAL